jgi:hypothetical protein
MLYSEIIAVCFEIHTKHRNTLCGQNVEFVNVKRGGTYSNHWAVKGSVIKIYLKWFHLRDFPPMLIVQDVLIGLLGE